MATKKTAPPPVVPAPPAEQMRWRLVDARRDVVYTRDLLHSAMKGFGENLTREAARMLADAAWQPNSLGVGQSTAQNVDRLCAVLDEKIRALRTLEAVALLFEGK